MWSRYVFISFFCLAVISYVASDETQNFGSISTVFEEKSYDQFGSLSNEGLYFDETAEIPKNQKEQGQESTGKKPNEKGTSKHSLREESQQPSTFPRVEPNESLEEDSNKNKDKDEKVCFKRLGCFDMGAPWKSLLRPVPTPENPEKIQTVIHFYSRQNLQDPVFVNVYPEIDMGDVIFDSTKKTVIIVHGFLSSGNVNWMKSMKDAYLEDEDANVMIVDWGKGAKRVNYLQVAGNTRVVGRELALLVRYLIENFGADPKKFHLIGHSLGAQICSYLGKEVQGIARLTALDPAQPAFEGYDERVRLVETDAEFVDVVHTDAKPFIPTLGFGMIAPQGHVDFYVNGGYAQPGCILPERPNITIANVGNLRKYTVEDIGESLTCSHAKSHEYFTEALNKMDGCTFWGQRANTKNVLKSVTNTLTQGVLQKITALSQTCSENDCIPLGFDTDKSPLRGIFVITTNRDRPYCRAENQEGMISRILNTLRGRSALFG